MNRLTSTTAAFVVAFAVASFATANELEQIASPFTQALLEDRLHSTVRAVTSKAPIKSVFGFVNGRYTQTAGKGKFKGAFQVFPGRRVSIAKFKFGAKGSIKAPGFSVRHKTEMYGAMKTYPKYVHVAATYGSYYFGMVSGQKIIGKCNGTMTAWVGKNGIYAKELGTYTAKIGRKPVYGKYAFIISNGAIYVKTHGKYNGKNFFFNYSMSLNLLKLQLQMNPMMITRKYGTIKLHIGKRVITKNFDIKGNQLFDASTMAALGTI